MTRRPAKISTRIHVLEDDLSPGSFELLATLEGFPLEDAGGPGEEDDEFETDSADGDDEFAEDEFDDADEELGDDFEEDDEFESDDSLEDDDEDDDFEDEDGFDAEDFDGQGGGEDLEGDALDLAGGGVGGAHP